MRAFQSEGWDLSQSMKKAIEYCKNNEIMVDFLRKYGKEAGHEVGRAEGHAEDRADEKIRIAQNFKLSGIPISVIAENTGLTKEEVEKL